MGFEEVGMFDSREIANRKVRVDSRLWKRVVSEYLDYHAGVVCYAARILNHVFNGYANGELADVEKETEVEEAEVPNGSPHEKISVNSGVLGKVLTRFRLTHDAPFESWPTITDYVLRLYLKHLEAGKPDW